VILDCDPKDPTRLCFSCGLHYKLEAFCRTTQGRLKSTCIKCNIKKKQEQIIKRNQFYNANRRKSNKLEPQKINLEITSTNKNVDLKRVKSLTVNFEC